MSTIINADTSDGLKFTSDTSGEIKLQSAGTDTVTVKSDGKVGIGTSSPTTTLDVETTIRSKANAASNDSTVGKVSFYNTNASASANPERAYIEAGRQNSAWGAYLKFATSDATSAASEKMRIDSSGNVMIGGTTKYGLVTIANSIPFDPPASGNLVNSALTVSGSYGGGITVLDGSQGYTMWSQNAGADCYIRRATTTGSYTGGVYISNAAGSWSSASDERLKNIIRPIDSALEKILEWRCVIGEYKDNEGAERPFLIAQDVQKTFPEAVNVMDKEKGYLGLSYTEIIPILTKAIQELKTENDTLKSQLSDLETRIQALENA